MLHVYDHNTHFLSSPLCQSCEMTEAEPDETFSQEVFDDSDIVVELKTTNQ